MYRSGFFASLVLFATVADAVINVKPTEVDEVHYDVDNTGMTANEKAGVTMGFVAVWFFLILITGFLCKVYSIASNLEGIVMRMKPVKADEES
mmetsp:Transcript_39615/g.55017  ORF Transcript_39615/g.55017 Transcript_39615/m.55017 type:complete len:93 (-) Transcript_39615:186-464(-)|eukprot:CAMPEP_0196570472 /NCGR_PEP_ID=MMETSP1081-20130531/566_1 /TAXON_ID=36882 /ORGANISM="Pyramimonas amylifera, Strain CCMP720" /LENGTH=92 /DNA_ID=CAMNT_0041886927 /DNA_START=89 /DNA_END=367 /DNA_ORIENTATION=-